jgi:hypothetical protein
MTPREWLLVVVGLAGFAYGPGAPRFVWRWLTSAGMLVWLSLREGGRRTGQHGARSCLSRFRFALAAPDGHRGQYLSHQAE